jgi:hypothetical protein
MGWLHSILTILTLDADVKECQVSLDLVLNVLYLTSLLDEQNRVVL